MINLLEVYFASLRLIAAIKARQNPSEHLKNLMTVTESVKFDETIVDSTITSAIISTISGEQK